MTTLQRIFEEFSITTNLHEIVNLVIMKQTSPESERTDVLQELFEFRNGLVHEIDFTLFGGLNNLGIEETLEYGQVVTDTIETIERCLTDNAPKTFPNLLDKNSQPLDYVADM